MANTMSDPDQAEFCRLMHQIQQGDAEAARQIIEQYEPEIRREVRIRLTDPRLRRVVDSVDICQSVLGNFFVRVALGQFDIAHPNQLFRLLSTMARNKIIDRHRSEQVRRVAHDAYLTEHRFDTAGEPLGKKEGPDSIAESREMLACALAQMTDQEKEIAALRQQGKSWIEVAEKTGINAAALRKRLSRACDRVLSQFTDT